MRVAASFAPHALFVLALAGTACGSTLPTETASIRIRVTSRTNTNDNRPLHCMVRAVEPAAAMIEDYDQAAVLLFTGDDTLLARDVIFPGHELELTVTIDPAQPVAVYFFFTNPGDGWVVPVPAPLPATLAIELGETEVLSWSPHPSEAPETDEAGELVLPPIGSAPQGAAAPALPEMPETPEVTAPSAPALPGRGR
jgi:hypothetical protein